MSFDASSYLRRATSRAKSDVANKLIGMFLHDVSRKLCSKLDLSVNDSRYTDAVALAFGNNCCYCLQPLENDRTAVEHLDGMNRFRAGLHIPGNVILACTRCNREKRRDDSNPKLTLAETGWESFLMHNSHACIGNCNSCKYWATQWQETSARTLNLDSARSRIAKFRLVYHAHLKINSAARTILIKKMDVIYRECQNFAAMRINEAVEEVLQELTTIQMPDS